MLSPSGEGLKKEIADKNAKLIIDTRNATKNLSNKEKIIKI